MKSITKASALKEYYSENGWRTQPYTITSKSLLIFNFFTSCRLNISTNKNNTVMLADFIYVLFEGAITESQIYSSTRAIQAAREAVKQLIS